MNSDWQSEKGPVTMNDLITLVHAASRIGLPRKKKDQILSEILKLLQASYSQNVAISFWLTGEIHCTNPNQPLSAKGAAVIIFITGILLNSQPPRIPPQQARFSRSR